MKTRVSLKYFVSYCGSERNNNYIPNGVDLCCFHALLLLLLCSYDIKTKNFYQVFFVACFSGFLSISAYIFHFNFSIDSVKCINLFLSFLFIFISDLILSQVLSMPLL